MHPWYVIPLVAFTVFTPYRYAVLWSGLIFFSYAGYSATGFSENLWITFVEYASVVVLLGYELVRRTRLVAFHAEQGYYIISVSIPTRPSSIDNRITPCPPGLNVAVIA